MTREEILKFLLGQLKELKEKNIVNLMKAKRIDELWEISEKIEFSPLQKFCQKKHLWLDISEIPEEYIYELVFYISQSGTYDYDIFRYRKDWTNLLRETKENLAVQIADSIEKYNLYNCTIRELVYGKKAR